jgi:hypothetical protein
MTYQQQQRMGKSTRRAPTSPSDKMPKTEHLAEALHTENGDPKIPKENEDF